MASDGDSLDHSGINEKWVGWHMPIAAGEMARSRAYIGPRGSSAYRIKAKEQIFHLVCSNYTVSKVIYTSF